jgi:hypothetical protein
MAHKMPKSTKSSWFETDKMYKARLKREEIGKIKHRDEVKAKNIKRKTKAKVKAQAAGKKKSQAKKK